MNIAVIWPSVNPMNVWDMPYDAWLLGLAAIEDLKQKEK